MKRILFGLMLLHVMAGCKHEPRKFPVRKDIVETVYASGKIQADSEYTVYALNAGTISRKLLCAGDLVRAGQPIYVISSDGPAASRQASEALLEHTRANLSPETGLLHELKIAASTASLNYTNDSLTLSRYQNLWAQSIGTRVNLDRVQTQARVSLNERNAAMEKYRAAAGDLRLALKQAESQAVNSRIELDRYVIRSASRGMVYQTLKEPGESVRQNEAIALLGKSTRRVIRLDVDQQDVSRLQKGQQVLLKADVSGDRILPARLERIYPVMNEADQTFRVDAVFDGTGTTPFIHSSVEANIVIRHKKNCLVIPSVYLSGGNQVVIRHNGKKKIINVRIGIRTQEEVEVLNGLDEHTEIIQPENP